MTRLNPDVVSGDRIFLISMGADQDPILPFTFGSVVRVSKDPFDPNAKLIEVKWDNGRSLSLVTTEDIYMLEEDLES